MSDDDTPLEFIGTSENDLSGFPQYVKREIGFALRFAQKGGKHPDAKPLKGFGGAGVLEFISNYHLIKADIVIAIADRIKARKLTQAQASKLIGLAQPHVSKMLRGHFTGYSFERLFGFLNALGENVTIAVSPAKPKKQGRLELELAHA